MGKRKTTASGDAGAAKTKEREAMNRGAAAHDPLDPVREVDLLAACAAVFKRRREQLGISQDRLAAASGVPQSIVGRMELGKNFRFATFVAVARGLGWTPMQAFFEVEAERQYPGEARNDKSPGGPAATKLRLRKPKGAPGKRGRAV